MRVATFVILATLTASVFASLVYDRASFAANAARASFDEGYVCYPGQFSGVIKRPRPMRLNDLFTRHVRDVPLGFPDAVCAPATSGLPPSASKGYLVCYPTTAITLGVLRRLATDDLGNLAMPAGSRRDVVCVESERVDQRERATPSTSRVFVCYRSGKTGTGVRRLRVRDTFRRTESVSAGIRYRGCAAARGASSAFTSPRYLLCSALNPGGPPGSLVLKNRFGYLKAALGARAALCLEASVG